VSAQTSNANTERTGHLGAGTWWQGRSGLIVPLIMGAFSTYLLVGILTMDVASRTQTNRVRSSSRRSSCSSATR
jgi:hypothetical protein